MNNLLKTIVLFTFGLFAVACGGWFLLNAIVTDVSIQYYPIIPLIFYAFGITLILALLRCKKDKGMKIVRIYMLLKVSKLIVAMITVLLAFVLMSKVEAKIFVMVFAIYFMFYILFETLFIYAFEKKQKLSK